MLVGNYQKEYLLDVSLEKFAAALRDEIQVKDFFHRLSLLGTLTMYGYVRKNTAIICEPGWPVRTIFCIICHFNKEDGKTRVTTIWRPSYARVIVGCIIVFIFACISSLIDCGDFTLFFQYLQSIWFYIGMLFLVGCSYLIDSIMQRFCKVYQNHYPNVEALIMRCANCEEKDINNIE